MDVDALLTRVLALTDATFLPIRASEWVHPKPGAIYLAQRDFHRHGGVAVPQGGGAAERKQAERFVAQLVGNGRLLARRRGRGSYLKLSDAAEDELRHRVGLPGLWLSLEAVRQLGPGWVPETALSDGNRGWGDGCDAELRAVEFLLLPALGRGHVEAASDIKGRVYYKRLSDPPTWLMPSVESFDTPPDAALGKQYLDELIAARDRITSAETSGRELGFLPMPSCGPSTLAAILQSG